MLLSVLAGALGVGIAAADADEVHDELLSAAAIRARTRDRGATAGIARTLTALVEQTRVAVLWGKAVAGAEAVADIVY